MDARLRKATEMEKRMALGRLFTALRVQHGDADDQIEVYVLALTDVTYHAMERVVLQAITGQHPSLSKKWAPTTAELGAAIRDEMTFIQKQIELAEQRLQIDDNRPVAVVPPRYFEKAADLRDTMRAERRKLVLTVSSHDGFLAKRKDIVPVLQAGGVYHALLGECYGPIGSLDAAPPVADLIADPAVASTPEPVTDDVAW